jgi:hypothetical protein
MNTRNIEWLLDNELINRMISYKLENLKKGNVEQQQ